MTTYHASARLVRIGLVAFLMSGCSVLTPTPMPTATATPNPTATSTATIDAGATQTAQAQSTATALAKANATLTAQAQATATARAQATAAVQAASTATVQAYVEGINATAQSVRTSPYVSKEGKVDGAPAPYITLFDPRLNLKNFDAEVQILNPADRAIHPWDYGFRFRSSSPNGYDLVIRSDGVWALILLNENLADAVGGKVVVSGTLRNIDVSPTGANTIRLFVREGSGAFFLNGEFVATLDTSGLNSGGELWLSTGLLKADNFPGLNLRYRNFTVKGLP